MGDALFVYDNLCVTGLVPHVALCQSGGLMYHQIILRFNGSTLIFDVKS